MCLLPQHCCHLFYYYVCIVVVVVVRYYTKYVYTQVFMWYLTPCKYIRQRAAFGALQHGDALRLLPHYLHIYIFLSTTVHTYLLFLVGDHPRSCDIFGSPCGGGASQTHIWRDTPKDKGYTAGDRLRMRLRFTYCAHVLTHVYMYVCTRMCNSWGFRVFSSRAGHIPEWNAYDKQIRLPQILWRHNLISKWTLKIHTNIHSNIYTDKHTYRHTAYINQIKSVSLNKKERRMDQSRHRLF